MRFSRWMVWVISVGCAQVAFASHGPQAEILPLSIDDNRPFVAVKIDGKGPFAFILDTGSSSSTVSTALAARLSLVASGSETGTGAGERPFAVSDVHVDDLSVGSFSLGALKLPALDISDVNRAIGFRHFDGVLGVEIFRDHVLTLDVSRAQLAIQREEQFKPGVDAVAIPLMLDENGTPLVSASIAGITGLFQIDTGDRFSLTLFGAFWRAYHLDQTMGTRVEAMTGYGGGGPIRGIVGRTKDVAMGPFQVPSVVTRLSLQKSGTYDRAGRVGSIGMGFLRRFTVSFDYGRHVMWLSKSSEFDAPDLYDRSGMWLGLSKNNELQVMDVVTRGPAARAGIQRGDIITRVGSMAANADHLFAIRAVLQDARTSRLSMAVSRAQGNQRVVLSLRTLID